MFYAGRQAGTPFVFGTASVFVSRLINILDDEPFLPSGLHLSHEGYGSFRWLDEQGRNEVEVEVEVSNTILITFVLNCTNLQQQKKK